MAATEWGNAGAFEVQVWTQDSNGYPTGDESDPDNLAQATEKHAIRLKSFVSLDIPTPTREEATFRGGQSFLGRIDLGVSEFGSGTLTLAQFEESFAALISGSTVDETTITDWTQTSSNSNNPNLPSLGIMGSTKVRLANGALSWVHVVVPNIQLEPAEVSISAGTGQNPNPLEYVMKPTLATRSVTGHLFSATSLNLTDDKAVSFQIRYNSRLGITTYKKDATDASAGGTFILGYRPTSTATGSPNAFTVNGVTVAMTSVTPATGTVAFGIAGAADDIMVAVYPTDFVAI